MYSGGIVNAEPSRTPYLGHHHLGLGVGSFLAALIMVRTLPHVLNWVTKTEAGLAYIGRSIPMLVAAIAGFFAFGQVVESLSPEYHQHDDVFLDVVSTFSDPITAIIAGFCLMFFFTLVFIIFMSWALVALPVILLLLLMILFRVVQFVVVRVAENSKGPQYALSVLLAAVGGAISRFT
jgi:ABC-type bacteriocin/lantibiotic exporter with double-glycine peptidase domain